MESYRTCGVTQSIGIGEHDISQRAIEKRRENYKLVFGVEIIRMAERHEVIQKYTTLNEKFTKRLKDENRDKDLVSECEKRLQNSPKDKVIKKRWRVKEK
ncbi:hypothetical protein RhiirA1_450449 [Rhizophagus irregularis]|uniref:Uncharacterized protein n=1 Tax=Rhizophagus irregularis TaxID=588596 RepID=A0A2I1EU30_9GLOM|nr:hypothetical protein RhiirA1_450449 [Rhizophagus irregularis]PKY25637.1 hypothetical protein RhiirB3_440663 [Rhizophagus irregularis]CAB4479248.1 unnamed protein product [Rhizophagus irregularis]CAB5362398.1 unnamed protein product [Rhizophagus irregularis]